MAVPSIMYGMDVTAWNENEIDKLEVGQNRVARMAQRTKVCSIRSPER